MSQNTNPSRSWGLFAFDLLLAALFALGFANDVSALESINGSWLLLLVYSIYFLIRM